MDIQPLVEELELVDEVVVVVPLVVIGRLVMLNWSRFGRLQMVTLQSTKDAIIFLFVSDNEVSIFSRIASADIFSVLTVDGF